MTAKTTTDLGIDIIDYLSPTNVFFVGRTNEPLSLPLLVVKVKDKAWRLVTLCRRRQACVLRDGPPLYPTWQFDLCNRRERSLTMVIAVRGIGLGKNRCRS
jgi:hypothetical protein